MVGSQLVLANRYTGEDSMASRTLQLTTQLLSVSVGLSIFAAHAEAQDYTYHYESLTNLSLPSGVSAFAPWRIDDRGRVHGTAFDADGVEPHVAVYADGVLTVRQEGTVSSTSPRGLVGGTVGVHPEPTQAALFRGDRTTLFPAIGGVQGNDVIAVNDADLALVWYADTEEMNRNTYRLFRRNRSVFEYRLPTGSDCSPCWDVNTASVVAGTASLPSVNAFRALRFEKLNKEPKAFKPPAPYKHSTSFGISEDGTIGVMAFNIPGTAASYGLWDEKGKFTKYFEGAIYQTVLSEKNWIVLTASDDATDVDSYIVPRPGQRKNLEDLIDNPEDLEGPLSQILAINRRGDMLGYGKCDVIPCPVYVLRRVPPDRD
jgi:hypothetical protein